MPNPQQILDQAIRDDIQHIGKSLRDHLLGTFQLLQSWGNSETVCLAGLLHSVYGTRTFTTAAHGFDKRPLLQALIGPEAEQLAYLFCASDRTHLLTRNTAEPLEWRAHRNGQMHSLTESELRALVEIEAANFLEQLPQIDSAEVVQDMHSRFEASQHLLSSGARKDLFAALATRMYQDTGCGVARGMLPGEEVNRLVQEAMRLWDRFRDDGPSNLRIGIRRDSSGNPILERLDPVSDVSALFQSINEHDALTGIARDGLREPVRVMKEKLTFKWPGTPGFGAHRDCNYNTPRCGVPGAEALCICVALMRADKSNGALELFPSLRNENLAAPPGEPRDVSTKALEQADSLLPVLQPGDAVVFDGLVPHRSEPNRGETPRLTYMVTFVPERYANARRDYYAARREEEAAKRTDLDQQSLFFE